MSFHLLCKSFIILLLACFCLGCFCFGFYSLVNWVYCFLGSQVQRNYIVHSLENFPHKYMHTVPQRADNESARQAKTFENLHYTFQLFVIASMRFVYCIKYAIYIVALFNANGAQQHHTIPYIQRTFARAMYLPFSCTRCRSPSLTAHINSWIYYKNFSFIIDIKI